LKAYIQTQSSTDGAVAKPQIITGLVNRYRSIAHQYREKQGDRLTAAQNLSNSLREGPNLSLRVEDRQADLAEFSNHYEAFVEAICDAAQLGISPTTQWRYDNARFQLVNLYVSIRLFLSAYLRPSGEDSRGAATGIRFDAFDALLAHASLEDFLQADDGHTISRITRTREAINLYAEHLKQLTRRTR
jgi:hypothetical protein